MNANALWAHAQAACGRRAAKWFGRRPFVMPEGPAIVSFTFDDFPRSALINGGAILERFGLAGTYYTSLGLADQTTVCGKMFSLEELGHLLCLGHELGCHTFDHYPAWTTPPAEFEASVKRNAAALQKHVPGAKFESHSYPISNPRPETKRRVSRHLGCCRGGGQTFNHGTIDLNYVSGFFLEQSRDDIAAIKRVITDNKAAGGWLIFATHEICDNPSRFGCLPGFFRQVVQLVLDSGADVLPVAKALQVLRGRSGNCLSTNCTSESRHVAQA
jgi:hypothetical protein